MCVRRTKAAEVNTASFDFCAPRMPIAQAFSARSRSSAATASCTKSSIDLARGRPAYGSPALTSAVPARRTSARRLDDVIGFERLECLVGDFGIAERIGGLERLLQRGEARRHVVLRIQCDGQHRFGVLVRFVDGRLRSSRDQLRISFCLAAMASAAGIGCRTSSRLGFVDFGSVFGGDVVDGQRGLAVAGKRRQLAGRRHAACPSASFPACRFLDPPGAFLDGKLHLLRRRPEIAVDFGEGAEAVLEFEQRKRPLLRLPGDFGEAQPGAVDVLAEGTAITQPRMSLPADSTLSIQLPPSR